MTLVTWPQFAPIVTEEFITEAMEKRSTTHF